MWLCMTGYGAEQKVTQQMAPISPPQDNYTPDRGEEQEENVAKIQADFSLYRADHKHSDQDYNSQLCCIQELQQV